MILQQLLCFRPNSRFTYSTFSSLTGFIWEWKCMQFLVKILDIHRSQSHRTSSNDVWIGLKMAAEVLTVKTNIVFQDLSFGVPGNSSRRPQCASLRSRWFSYWDHLPSWTTKHEGWGEICDSEWVLWHFMFMKIGQRIAKILQRWEKQDFEDLKYFKKATEGI